jgi:hypothetical protein
MSSFNVSAQTVAPAWVQARTLSLYLLVFQGAIALGSVVWGAIAGRAGSRVALESAAAGLVVSLAASLRYHLTSGEGLDLAPSLHWPAPVVRSALEPERGPVMVTVEYRIQTGRARGFEKAMRQVEEIKRRDGAIFWNLFVDAADPARYVEFFMVESWVEHLRQHERVTVTDKAIEDRAHSFHVGPGRPQATHYVASGLGRGERRQRRIEGLLPVLGREGGHEP